MTNTVLIVDDEQVLAEAMADYLGRHGYKTTVTSSGEDALRVIDREPPDIVVLDYRLPRKNGETGTGKELVARSIHARSPRAKRFYRDHFVRLHARRYSRGEKQLSESARSIVASYRWPGNVRELSNVMERAVLLKSGTIIDPRDLALTPVGATPMSAIAASDGVLTVDLSKGIVLEELQRSIIQKVLERSGWNRTRAAHLLGLSRETLRYRIEKYSLKAPGGTGEP